MCPDVPDQAVLAPEETEGGGRTAVGENALVISGHSLVSSHDELVTERFRGKEHRAQKWSVILDDSLRQGKCQGLSTPPLFSVF